MGFKVPTKIQAEAIPVVLSNRHLLVNAATGTGKTIVYLAPIVHMLQMEKPRVQRADGTFALVLVPTQELCMQVYGILQSLLHRFIWIVPGYIMGGENKAKEKARLRKGISILIATPGRLLDHLQTTSSFKYKKLRWIVFDEADRILELGLGKTVEEILDIMGSRNDTVNNERKEIKPEKYSRQNLLLSATLNEKVNELASISLENPVMVGINNKKISSISNKRWVSTLDSTSDVESDLELQHKPSTQLQENYNLPTQLFQRYIKVSCGSRLVVLLSILKFLCERGNSQKIVVFFSTCASVDFQYALINKFQSSSELQSEVNHKKKFVSCSTFRLHGKMVHNDRKKAFQSFTSENSAVLLCTDVATRGLDIPKVKYIIQYDGHIPYEDIQ